MSEQMDKIFREKLGRYKAEVPPDLWTAIAADQSRKRQQTRLLTYGKFALALLLLVAVGIASWPAATSEADAANTTTAETTATQIKGTTSANTPENTAPTKQNTPTDAVVDVNSVQAPEAPNPPREAVSRALPQPAHDVQLAVANELDPTSTSADQTAIAAPDVTIEEETGLENQSVALLPTLPLPRLSPRQMELPDPQLNVSQLETTGFIRARGQRLEVDLLAGPSYANQLFHNKNEDNREVLDAREISEFPEVSFLAGLRFSYRLKHRWSLRSGLLYTQIRNQFEYEQEGSQPNEPTQLIVSSNRIRLLEVPLLLSYELPGKRFRLSLNAGAVVNLSTKASGRYLLPGQMEPVQLEDDNIYRSNIGLSYQASLTAAYDLGMGNSLLIEPTFKTYRTSFTLDTYALEERYWLAGLQVGLRHRIR